MSNSTQTARPLEDFTMAELWKIATSLEINKSGTKEELIKRIREIRNTDDGESAPKKEMNPKKVSVKKETARVRKTSKQIFVEAIFQINMHLAENPGILDIVKVKKRAVLGDSEAFINAYSWAENSQEAKELRRDIKEKLEVAWQSGALNYEIIASKIRLPVISVKALLDKEFIEANNL